MDRALTMWPPRVGSVRGLGGTEPLSRPLPSVINAREILGLGADDKRCFLTVKEVAEIFGVTELTVRRWAQDPKIDLRTSRLGPRVVRIDIREAARLIQLAATK